MLPPSCAARIFTTAMRCADRAFVDCGLVDFGLADFVLADFC
jgi:hypothetical protein